METPFYFYIPTDALPEQELDVVTDPENGTVEFLSVNDLGFDPDDFPNAETIIAYTPNAGFEGVDTFFISINAPSLGFEFLVGIEMLVFGEAPADYESPLRVMEMEDGITGIKDIEVSNINIFPNPARDIINIDLSEESSGTLTVQMFDRAGRQVLQQEINNVSARFTLNVESLPQGLYFVRVETPNKIYSGKVNKSE